MECVHIEPVTRNSSIYVQQQGYQGNLKEKDLIYSDTMKMLPKGETDQRDYSKDLSTFSLRKVVICSSDGWRNKSHSLHGPTLNLKKKITLRSSKSTSMIDGGGGAHHSCSWR
ncbi:hypothetical protein OROMI_012421 [Orobanche minor]